MVVALPNTTVVPPAESDGYFTKLQIRFCGLITIKEIFKVEEGDIYFLRITSYVNDLNIFDTLQESHFLTFTDLLQRNIVKITLNREIHYDTLKKI